MNLEGVKAAAEAEREASERLRDAILAAYAERWSPTKIAEASDLSRATVHRIVRAATAGQNCRRG